MLPGGAGLWPAAFGVSPNARGKPFFAWVNRHEFPRPKRSGNQMFTGAETLPERGIYRVLRRWFGKLEAPFQRGAPRGPFGGTPNEGRPEACATRSQIGRPMDHMICPAGRLGFH